MTNNNDDIVIVTVSCKHVEKQIMYIQNVQKRITLSRNETPDTI